MPEGCNLHFTNVDFKEIQSSLDKGLPKDQKRFASSILRIAQKNNFKKLMNSLSNPKDLHYDLVSKSLIKAFGEGKVIKPMEADLNKALYTVLKDHPDPQGLFEKPPVHRGPGSTSVDHPYEVLCAAALIQSKCNSSIGKKLRIYPTDRLDLGQKSPSINILSTAKKNTIESDILIERRKNFTETETIGIDAKYTKYSTYAFKEADLIRQLAGVKSALSDESITEYHFVTNAKFSDKFKRTVDNTNRELIAEAAIENKELYNDFKEMLPLEESATADAVELALKIDFEKDREKINELVKERVPQIGYSEKVIFENYD